MKDYKTQYRIVLPKDTPEYHTGAAIMAPTFDLRIHSSARHIPHYPDIRVLRIYFLSGLDRRRN